MTLSWLGRESKTNVYRRSNSPQFTNLVIHDLHIHILLIYNNYDLFLMKVSKEKKYKNNRKQV